MSMLKKLLASATACLVLTMSSAAFVQAQSLGTPVDESQLQGFDLIAPPDGSGYPEGSGTAIQGKAIFEQRCVACHGMNGEGTSALTRLVGGDMQSEERPIRTVGSYWPHASTLFDYVQRAMPADAPKSLSSSEVYQVIAYILNMNGIVEESLVLNKDTLMQVEMPNRDGFIDSSQAP
ncbi:MAG: cytochrome c [Pseudohongiella sp.]|nr:MAG: cytochrome c [Pseudohongiella sp.]